MLRIVYLRWMNVFFAVDVFFAVERLKDAELLSWSEFFVCRINSAYLPSSLTS